MNPRPPDDEALFSGDEFPLDDEGLSLEDLGAAYAKAAAEQDPDAYRELDSADAGAPAPSDSEPSADSQDDRARSADPIGTDTDEEGSDSDDHEPAPTPEAIVEGALFVGHPDNQPLTAARIASLMRDVTPEEVEQTIAALNDSYRQNDQALRIVADEAGYRMTVCPEVESVRRSFLGKVREARLNQAAIEVLSLVAYQPGITAQKVTDQRGRESHSILNQMVRRQLLLIERIKPETGGRSIPHYYPTERFLFLFGLQSLEDLPQVEEGLREI